MDTPPPASNPAAPLAARLGILAPSATLATVARIRRLQAEGEAILDLTAGEPDFNPPPAAEQAAQEATAAGKGRYTAAAGMMPLRRAVATQLGRDWGLPYEPTQVVVTHGAKLAIAQALMAMLDPGDEVLIPIPSWTSYPEMVKLAGGEPVTVPCRADLLPHVEDLEAARTPRSKVLLLNTPCNPTGVVYPPDCLEALGRWALEHGIRLISDEIYGMLTFSDAVHRSPLALVPELQATSAWIGGMSKTYAMTGWRMGFLAGPPDLAKAVATIQSQLAGSPHAISQIASQAAIEQADADVARMVAAFSRRAALVQEGLDAIPELDARAPEGAFYAWIDCKPILGRRDPATGRVIRSGDDFCEVLLEADRVAGMVGSAFGDADFLRLSFATSEEVLAEALARLAARVAALETV